MVKISDLAHLTQRIWGTAEYFTYLWFLRLLTMESIIYWDVNPSSGLKSKLSKKPERRVYLTLLLVQDIALNSKIINDELEWMWKKAITACFKRLSWNSPWGSEKALRNLNQNVWCPGQDSNWAPPKYMSEMLLPEPASLVWDYNTRCPHFGMARMGILGICVPSNQQGS